MAALPSLAPETPENPSSAFDSRVVEVTIDFEDGAQTFQGLNIYACGRKYLGTLMNECELYIFNLTEEQRNYILTTVSPLNKQRKNLTVSLKVGRISTGTFLLYTGNIISCNVSQPPDIAIVMRSLTSNFFTGTILNYTQGPQSLLSTNAAAIAKQFDPPLKLDFQATDKQIDNFSYTGSPLLGVQKLNEVGGVQATIDNDTLLVVDANKARKGEPRLINLSTGMVGIPQVTEQGCIVKMMLDNTVQLGDSVQVESKINPAANGVYKVIKMNFEVSNRDDPFWYTLECSQLPYYQGTV